MRSAEIDGPTEAKSELIAALAGWDNEGGSFSPGADAQAVPGQVGGLPTEIQRRQFQQAAGMDDPRHQTRLKEEIARFLHKHKNYDTAEASALDRPLRTWSAEPPQVRIEQLISLEKRGMDSIAGGLGRSRTSSDPALD